LLFAFEEADMAKKKIALDARKEPQQERSRQMREDILTAALRVLRKEGALRFTTPRVAEAAGISVGSLYQYFPNKQALVFAIHTRTVELAWIEVQKILERPRSTPRQKIRDIARMFFLQESAEAAEMGAALQEAEIFFAGQPEYRALDAKVEARFTRFVRASIPETSNATARFKARLLITVLESTGKSVAAMGLSRREVHRWSRACSDMLADHLGLS
jgi:AcrR family transcriptional regulator